MNESAQSAREQRSMRRFAMQLPVQVKTPEGVQDAVATTKDVSARGVFIYLDSEVAENTPIEFTLTLPPEITMTQSIRVQCRGKIVRIERDRPGKIGVAAVIDHYEFLENE